MATKLSGICDQQRSLHTDEIDWKALRGVRVIYLECMRDNVTVYQPDAREMVQQKLEGIAGSFEWIEVDSTHCGFLERPATWGNVLDKIFDSVD